MVLRSAYTLGLVSSASCTVFLPSRWLKVCFFSLRVQGLHEPWLPLLAPTINALISSSQEDIVTLTEPKSETLPHGSLIRPPAASPPPTYATRAPGSQFVIRDVSRSRPFRSFAPCRAAPASFFFSPVPGRWVCGAGAPGLWLYREGLLQAL